MLLQRMRTALRSNLFVLALFALMQAWLVLENSSAGKAGVFAALFSACFGLLFAIIAWKLDRYLLLRPHFIQASLSAYLALSILFSVLRFLAGEGLPVVVILGLLAALVSYLMVLVQKLRPREGDHSNE